MEDLDKPREVKGAADTILHQLEAFGFEWDSEVIYQSQRSKVYENALETLKNKQLIYPCTCTRKEIADSSTSLGIDGMIYPQTCLTHPLKPHAPQAWRIKTPHAEINFHDGIQGTIKQNLAQEVGDFILKRADGLFAYQLAVVVDDAAQGITHIVRGADLLDSAPRQIYLQRCLGYPTAQYAHVPAATNAAGEKLSKQTLAPALHKNKACSQLWQALSFLGQNPPLALEYSNLQTIWNWATNNWSMNKVAACRYQTT